MSVCFVLFLFFVCRSSHANVAMFQPSQMPKFLEPFSIVSSIQCLQPVTLLPIEERRQYTRSFKGRPKKLGSSSGKRRFFFFFFFFS